MRQYVKVFVGLICASMTLGGCGGGGSTPGEVKGQLTASNGRCTYYGEPYRPADLWMCTALQSGRGSVVMRSNELDNCPITGTVQSNGSLTRLDWCDDFGIGGAEESEFAIIKDQTYFVIATTPNNGPETGSYSLTFSKEFGNVRQVKLDPGQVILTTNSAQVLRKLADPASPISVVR